MSTRPPSYLCPKCGFVGAHPSECPRCGLIFAKYRAAIDAGEPPRAVAPSNDHKRVADHQPGPSQSKSVVSSEAAGVLTSLLEYNSELALRWALPAAFGFAILAKLTKVPALVLDYFRVWLHELGHATIAWCGSRAATPLVIAPGFAWTSNKPGKSTLVYLCFLFLIGVLGYYGARQKRWFAVVLAGTLFVAQSYFTFIASPLGWEQTVLWSGVGGELVLGALCVVAFYYRLPERLHWDFFRYLLLVIGMYSLLTTTTLWWQVRSDSSLIPWGTGFGGRGDSNGDMNRLHHLFGWSEARLSATYLATGIAGFVAVIVHYVVFLLRGRERVDLT